MFRIATWSEDLLIVLAAHKLLMADEYDDCDYGRAVSMRYDQCDDDESPIIRVEPI